MTSTERWTKAQSYERGHWTRLAQNLADDPHNLEWYSWRADRLTAMLAEYASDLDLSRCSVLEVGSGPVGTISYLKAQTRHAIDPLADFYAEHPSLIQLRDREVQYHNGGGEALSFEAATFNLVIIDNVIDHTKSPATVLAEIHRVLKPGGVLYLSVNVRTPWGLRVRQGMELFQLDKGHPHSYSRQTARQLLKKADFDMLHEEVEDIETARAKERQSGHLRSRIKLLLGVYDVLFEAVTRRR